LLIGIDEIPSKFKLLELETICLMLIAASFHLKVKESVVRCVVEVCSLIPAYRQSETPSLSSPTISST
jgi:hypothetical protein